jgi:hypothetical protein
MRMSASAKKQASMRAVRKVLAALCFVIGAAFALGTTEALIYSSYDDSGAGLSGQFV